MKLNSCKCIKNERRWELINIIATRDRKLLIVSIEPVKRRTNNFPS